MIDPPKLYALNLNKHNSLFSLFFIFINATYNLVNKSRVLLLQLMIYSGSILNQEDRLGGKNELILFPFFFWVGEECGLKL